MPSTYDNIATTTVSGSAIYTYTFTSIPQTYTDLILVMGGKSDGNNNVGIQYNNDNNSVYAMIFLQGNGTSATSGRTTNTDNISFGTMTTQISLLKVNISNYTGSTFKTSLAEFSADANGSGVTRTSTGLWRNTAAITSLKLISWFDVGTVITLYGVKNA